VAKSVSFGIIVTDAGPLIALAAANLIELTVRAFGKLAAPQAVIDECTSQIDAIRAQLILECVQNGKIVSVANTQFIGLDAAYSQGLGNGEVAVLAYAKLNNSIALVDERRARKVAQLLQVKVIGTGAVLVELKRRELIPSVKPPLESWKKHGYFLSESVLQLILRAANEDR
jgi:uncharacterized protein